MDLLQRRIDTPVVYNPNGLPILTRRKLGWWVRLKRFMCRWF